MRAIAAGAGNASELGRRLSVTKQAAAKTIALLEQRGYIAREAQPGALRTRLRITAHGVELLRQGEAIFEDLRQRWEKRIGSADLEKLEALLTILVGPSPIQLDAPGRFATEPGEPG
ncbi:MarR family transcriptional regulator [Sphingomonas sp. MG17]|uniref:MarR family transcriptional regulator n=1 Tax=Sphingomonas tagetis TaxID=2949092 RepID=A0A9X2HMU6_9SPHN|nr:MarR family transcriptional regulator [Sphingomonas tagetis]MCP3731346.1 MarR family transcriptional regulator [Sphingomonas tagetis]